MKIDFRETPNDLQTRIDIHSQFGARNIDQWMLDLLKPAENSAILDVACGSGKQCFSFYNYLNGKASITGGDVAVDLLEQARAADAKIGSPMQFIELDFNQPFALPSDHYDLVSCCFAIYYSNDIPLTIAEMHRVLKPGGRLFTTGPMPANKQFFYDVIREATGKPIPPMPGSSRYSSEIYGEIAKTFSKVEITIFENPLKFEAVEPFIAYTRASMSEDRKLWNSFFQTRDDFEVIMSKIEAVAKRRLDQDGHLTMTKVVGGFVATR